MGCRSSRVLGASLVDGASSGPARPLPQEANLSSQQGGERTICGTTTLAAGRNKMKEARKQRRAWRGLHTLQTNITSVAGAPAAYSLSFTVFPVSGSSSCGAAGGSSEALLAG